MLACYLTGGEGFDAPQKLRDILDGHLQTEAVSFEEQRLGLLEKLTSSTGLSSDHSLCKKRSTGKNRVGTLGKNIGKGRKWYRKKMWIDWTTIT